MVPGDKLVTLPFGPSTPAELERAVARSGYSASSLPTATGTYMELHVRTPSPSPPNGSTSPSPGTNTVLVAHPDHRY